MSCLRCNELGVYPGCQGGFLQTNKLTPGNLCSGEFCTFPARACCHVAAEHDDVRRKRADHDLFPGRRNHPSEPVVLRVSGTNGRTCFSCHQSQNNWSITPTTLLTTYVTTLGKDPLFAPVDGADCPTSGAAANTFGLKFIHARVQLFTKGYFRIFLSAPANPQWVSVAVSSDPTGCELNPTYGLPSGGLSFYRRPLPATNMIYTSPGRRKNPDGTLVPNI